MQKPKGLKARGGALWGTVTGFWHVPPDLLPILEHACRTADDLVRLQEALDGADLVVTGSTGQPVPHPLISTVRAHRELLARLLRQLDLPELPDEAGAAEPSARSERAQRAANTRWANVRAIREGVGL